MSSTSFPPADLPAWRALVSGDLGDKGFEKLRRETLEGVAVEPLYARETASLPASAFVRGTGSSSWLITERIAIGDPLRANAVALEAIADGADALWIVLDAAGRQGVDRIQTSAGDLVGKDGVAIVTVADVGALLAGVDLARTKVFFDAGANAIPLAALVDCAMSATPAKVRETGIVVGLDPLGALSRDGVLPRAFADLVDEMRLVSSGNWLGSSPVTPLISSTPYHAAGASAVLELGLWAATLVASKDLGSRVTVEICASPDVFLTVAKVRALRALHAKVAHVLGRSIETPFIVGRTSPRSVSQRDPHTNMVRTTTEAFGLALAGVDALVAAPFDEALGESEPSARKLARHTQLVLREESRIANVVDPASGSYYVEALTDDLARKAWDIMRSIESEGGMLAAISSGSVQRRVEAAREVRHAALAKRSEVRVGINDYVLHGEKLLTRQPARSVADRAHAVERAKRAALVELPNEPRAEKVTATDLAAFASLGASIGAISHVLDRSRAPERASRLDPVRDGERFEAVRNEADLLSSGGTAPKAVIACLGAPAEYRAREGFARKFLENGGIEVTSVDSPESIATKWIATREEVTNADLVCLAGTDERYGELGRAAIRTIRSAYPSVQIVIAGRAAALAKPDARVEESADLEIYLGCDAVAALASILQRVRLRRRRAAATTRRLA